MDNAMKFITDKGYPNYTQVARIVEGGEPPLFCSYFEGWKGPQVRTNNSFVQVVTGYSDQFLRIFNIFKEVYSR